MLQGSWREREEGSGGLDGITQAWEKGTWDSDPNLGCKVVSRVREAREIPTTHFKVTVERTRPGISSTHTQSIGCPAGRVANHTDSLSKHPLRLHV